MIKQSYIDYMVEHDMATEGATSFGEAYVNITHTEKVVLIYLLKKEKATMGQIGVKINMSKSATNFVVGKIVKLDFVKKTRSVEDNRVVYVTLTESGLKYVKELADILSSRFTKYVSNYLAFVKSEVNEDDQIALDKVIGILSE